MSQRWKSADGSRRKKTTDQNLQSGQNLCDGGMKEERERHHGQI